MALRRKYSWEPASAPLQQLRDAYPNAAIYLSGTLTVDFPEEIKLPILPDQYQSISLSGATVQMDYCNIEGAIALLKEQYAIGTITAKVIQPLPNL